MDRAAAFLEAIRHQPDDDTPRLIFADWLEEYGGATERARAGFIRAQCALARLPVGDSTRPALEDEARGLLAEHEAEWAAPLAGVAHDWEFRRGFVEWAQLSGDALLRQGDVLFATLPLRDLKLGLVPAEAAPAGKARHLQHLERLDLSGGRTRDRTLEEFFGASRFPRLRTLDLADNGIEGAAVRALAGSGALVGLTRLDLSGNHSFGDRAARTLAAACEGARATALRGLGLADTNLTCYGVRDLLCSSSLAGLEELDVSLARRNRSLVPVLDGLTAESVRPRLAALDVSGNLGGDLLGCRLARNGLRRLGVRACGLGDRAVPVVASVPGLTALDLGDNSLGPDAAAALAAAEASKDLRTLRLAGNRVRDKGAKDLAASPHLGRLEVLDLSGNDLGGPGVRALADSPALAELAHLSLAGNFVGGAALVTLLTTSHLPRLTRLDLSHIRLGPDGASALAAGPNLDRLAELGLAGNRLGDAGAAALADSPHVRRLTSLDLSANGIGPAGVAALVRSPYLTCRIRLNLAKNDLDDRGLEVLTTRFGRQVVR